jgi:DNA ligase-1
LRPELVFEIAFEGIRESSWHKSGLAVRFPRIARWRREKKIEEIDTMTRLKKLLLSP